MLSIVLGIVSRPITVAPCSLSQSTPRATSSLPVPLAWILRAHRERSHPAFGARTVDHVECDDPPSVVAPQHRALGRIFDGVSPDGRIEERHANAWLMRVPTISLGERVAEDLVQVVDVLERGRDAGRRPTDVRHEREVAISRPLPRAGRAPPAPDRAIRFSTREIPDSFVVAARLPPGRALRAPTRCA